MLKRLGFNLLLVLCVLVLASAAAGHALAQEPEDFQKLLSAANRLTYGPGPGDIDSLKKLGLKAFLDEQLKPGEARLPDFVQAELASFKTVNLDPVTLFREYGPPKAAPGATLGPKEMAAARLKAGIIAQEAAAATLLRAVYSPRQLEELMVEFWSNYFNIFAGKGLGYLWVGAFEREVIRPHSLGRFTDLLLAATRHPAMLAYFENWRNVAPEAAQSLKRGKGINEEFARELLRCHTLGPDGAYKPAEVKALARIFTGWSIGAPRSPKDSGGFSFDPKAHDGSAKQFLGQTFKSQSENGVEEGEEALRLLAAHPATARNVSRRLLEFFLCDDPPKPLIERLAKEFSDTGGDMAKVLRCLCESPEFWDKKYAGRFKSPRRYVVSLLRAAGLKIENPWPLLAAVNALGQPFFANPDPLGYKYRRETWLTPELLAKRQNFAALCASGKQGLGLKPDELLKPESYPLPGLDGSALQKNLPGTFSDKTVNESEKLKPVDRAALLLASPDFMQY